MSTSQSKRASHTVDRFLSNDANLVQCVREEDYDTLVAQVRQFETWLSERADWLRDERNKGGNWEYLLRKEEETRYCLEKLRAFVPAQKRKCPSCHGQGCEPHLMDDGHQVCGPACVRCGGSGEVSL